MNSEVFETIIGEQIEKCRGVLVNKGVEYATEDLLHAFKTAAELQSCTIRQALAGMMAKHTVSIFDLCGDDVETSLAVWDEKITDHINYLLLLRAVVHEELAQKLDLCS